MRLAFPSTLIVVILSGLYNTRIWNSSLSGLETTKVVMSIQKSFQKASIEHEVYPKEDTIRIRSDDKLPIKKKDSRLEIDSFFMFFINCLIWFKKDILSQRA